MPEINPAAGRTGRPGPAARLLLLGLPLFFLAFWAGLLGLLGRTLSQLVPAALTLDPAVLLLWLTLAPMTIHLAQALFHMPPQLSGPPVFLGLLAPPLVFLPFAGPGRLIAGPAFFAAAGPEDQALILAEAEARLKHGGLAGRLSLLAADRSPLDLGLRILGRGPWLLSAPARLIHLLTSPMRQLIRVWGYLFFRAAQAWADPGPAGDLTLYKRRLAWDLWRRARTLDPPAADETLDDQIRRLTRLRARLAHLYQDPHYGAETGAPWPEAEASGEPEKTWLAPRYRGVFSDLPVTLYAKEPAELYATGRPEKNLSLFYPPELTLEAEDAIFLAAESEFLADILADQAEEGLVRLDGRLRPTWELTAELSDLKARYDLALKRIFTHQARCRAAHLARAEVLGRGWPETLRAWGAILWLAEHGRQALTRAREVFQANTSQNVFPAAERFYSAWTDLQIRLAGLANLAPANLAPPTKSNWPQWQSGCQTAWADLDRDLAELRDQALTSLLAAEDQVAEGRAEPAPALLTRMPATGVFPVTQDRSQPLRVYYPSTRLKVGPGRAALAALTLALIIWQGWTQGLSQVTIYNGLSAAVTVTANGRTVNVPPTGHQTIRLRPGTEYEFTAASGGRALEQFRQRLIFRPAREIYNVAGAAPLMEWWFPRAEEPGGSFEFFLGRPRWLVTRATMLFSDPSGDQRALVLSGYGDASPAEILAPFPDPDERAELARLHARHTSPDDPRFQIWLSFLPEGERTALAREVISRSQGETGDPPLPDPAHFLELMETELEEF